MGARFLILIAIAAGMAIFLVTRTKPSAQSSSGEQVLDDDGSMTAAEKDWVEKQKTELWKIPLAGPEPAVPPKFAVVPEVNLSSGKNQLCFVISEEHGYFVETMTLQFWHTGPNGTDTPETSSFVLEEAINDFIEVDKPLRHCLEIVPAEMKRLNGSLGTAENWKAKINSHHRARVENPKPLPEHPSKTLGARPAVKTGKSPQPKD